MKRTIKIISVLSIIIILLMPNTCLADEEIDYKSKLNDYDLSSFELLDDDASNLLKDLGKSNQTTSPINAIPRI